MISMAGSIESCDCLITLYDSDKLEIEINSPVIIQYGEQINLVILNTLNEFKITNIKVVIDDKGALDYTIRARLITALKRGGYHA